MPEPTSALQTKIATAMAHDDALVHPDVVRALIGGVSQTYLKTLTKSGRLGPTVKLSHRVVRYRARHVKAFLAQQGAAAA